MSDIFSSSKQSVFVVDDSQDIIFLYKTVLEKAGYVVQSASSGQQAMQMLEKAPLPDLVLLDIQMEDMSGPQMLEKMEHEMPLVLSKVPFVLLTGMDVIPNCKVSGVIHKPIDLDTFINSVKQFIDKGVL